MDKTEQLKEMLANSTNVVFFGGAGVSTESGIPDFRRDRKSVVQGKSVKISVDLGGRRIIKKKKKK